jgi:hypothetical protein
MPDHTGEHFRSTIEGLQLCALSLMPNGVFRRIKREYNKIKQYYPYMQEEGSFRYFL